MDEDYSGSEGENGGRESKEWSEGAREFSDSQSKDEESAESSESEKTDSDEPPHDVDSTFGEADLTMNLEESPSRLAEEGISVWEGGPYEESDVEEESPSVAEAEGDLGFSKAQTPVKSPSPAVDIKPSILAARNRTVQVKIDPPPERPCVRDRMRKWLNRDRAVEPHKESFLGIPYSERDAHLDHKDPCKSFYFEKKAPTKYVVFDDDKKIGQRCVCTSTTQKSSKQSSSTSKLNEVTSKDVCTCISKSYSAQQLLEMGSSGRDQAPEKSGVCTCDEKSKGLDETSSEQLESEKLKEKIRKLKNIIKKSLTHKTRYCRKMRWKLRGKEYKMKRTCTCGLLRRRRRRLHRAIKRLWEKEREIEIVREMEDLRNERIEQLYKAIGPKLAAEYRQLAKKCARKNQQPTNRFKKNVMKEFGRQLQKNKLKGIRNGTIFTYYDSEDFTSFQYVELLGGSVYYGQFSPLGMEGKCIYKMAHGPIFVGTMVDGKMEGPGRIIYPNGGTVDGTWVDGALYDPKYTFADGLKFKPTGWKYCRMPDRRFVSEIKRGMKSPDNVQLCANHPARQIPKGCLDAGEGFYDPQRNIIIHPSTGKTVRIVGEHEGQWILKNCRREWFEEVPFSRYMYENWYAGTVFAPPLDEADWFSEEFPEVMLPYNDVEELIQARKAAALAAERSYDERSLINLYESPRQGN